MGEDFEPADGDKCALAGIHLPGQGNAIEVHAETLEERMQTDQLRKDFDTVLSIPEESGIEWHPGRQQYLTKIDIWKATAKGRTLAFQGWCLAAEHYEA